MTKLSFYDPYTYLLAAAAFIILLEIGRHIANYISKKENQREGARNTLKKLAQKRNNAYSFPYNGPVFVKAQNRHHAFKTFLKFKEEQLQLEDLLKKKKEKSNQPRTGHAER